MIIAKICIYPGPMRIEHYSFGGNILEGFGSGTDKITRGEMGWDSGVI